MFDFDVITGPGPLAAKEARRERDQEAPKSPAPAEESIVSPAEPDRAALPASTAVRKS
jgi:hypothetical protein